MSFLYDLKEPTTQKNSRESSVLVHELLMQLKASPAKIFVI